MRSVVGPLLLLILGLGLMAGAPALTRSIEALLVVHDAALGAGPSPLKALTPAPTRQAVAWVVGGRTVRGDLYRGIRDGAGVVLVPGATPAGARDPYLTPFAETLARAGFTVLVPQLSGIERLNLGPHNVRELADAATALAARDDRKRPVGLFALSYAVGPAVLAALEPEARDTVGFVVAVGGYYDVASALTFATTGAYRLDPDGPWRVRMPNTYGLFAFLHANLNRLDSQSDRDALGVLSKIPDRKTAIRHFPLDMLTPQGRAVAEFVLNDDPARVPALLAALPAAIRADLAALDLARADLSALRAELIILHGRDDPLLPWTESERLAAAAPKGQARLYLLERMRHVQPGFDDLDDISTLVDAARAVLVRR